VVESRFKKQDKKLKAAFSYIYDHGTEHLDKKTIQNCLTSREIKLKTKDANVCGLQLVDIIAHPSHQWVKSKYTGKEMTARFGLQVAEILNRSRYRRHPKTGAIDGYGIKRLP
jgi:ATP-dependent RNA circularization protein (DNA/RNA ligase family)